jgi:hypothetical protein
MRKNREEEQHQVAFVQWFRAQYPRYADLLTIASFGENVGARRMGRLKQMGLTAGYPDLVLYLPKRTEHYRYSRFGRPEEWTVEFIAGLFIEMKSKDGIIGNHQHEIHEKLRKYHYKVEVAYNWDEAKLIISEYFRNCPEIPDN